jgi:hypothetical protein
MDRACSTNGGKRNTYRLSVGKPEGKRPLGHSRCGCVDIKMDVAEIICMGWCGLDWWSGQGPVESSCEYGNEPLSSIKNNKIS